MWRETRSKDWTFNGEGYLEVIPLTIQSGQCSRLRVRHMTMISQSMDLHGHSFQLGAAGGNDLGKDTVPVPPRRAL